MPPTALDARTTSVHVLGLVLFSAVLFVPMMGRGFVLDDFGHVFVASQDPFLFGLTRASGGPFYAPVAYLTFKLDWLSSGANPFAWAATNLSIHVCNVLLLYGLAWCLWESQRGAWWAAFGFSLLYPANAHNVMFIAARAHLIAAFFSLAAMLAASAFARAHGSRSGIATLVVGLAGLAMFAKESGLVALAAIAIVVFYEDRRGRRRASRRDLLALGGGLLAVLGLYIHMRSRSGAIGIDFAESTSYRFLLSPSVIVGNLLAYAGWTYGLLVPVVMALITASGWRAPANSRRRPDAVDVLFSLALFAAAIAPFLLIGKRPDSYAYMPGAAAALLVAPVARSLPRARGRLAALAPIVIVSALYGVLAVAYSQRWLVLARTNASILSQIRERRPQLEPGTLVTLLYDEADERNRFPEGFSHWCFRWAIRVAYAERHLDGRIVRIGQTDGVDDKAREVRFSYAGTEAGPMLTELTNEATWR